jgi:hypothetical protein
VGSKALNKRVLPNIIGVGVGRSGTTWLYSVLTGHVGTPRRIKETNFFLHNYNRGIDWYKSLFRHCVPDRPILEISPMYFNSADARKRIRLHIPDCRIVCTFREPVERLYSQYKLMRRNVYTRLSFEAYATSSRQAEETNRYALHLREWHRTFGRDNTLVCLYDDLVRDPQNYLASVCSFMGISPFRLDPSAASARVNTISRAPRNRHLAQNARHVRVWLWNHSAYRLDRLLARIGLWDFCLGRGASYPALDPPLAARLRQKFRPEVDALEELIGRDLSAWRANPDETEGEASHHHVVMSDDDDNLALA